MISCPHVTRLLIRQTAESLNDQEQRAVKAHLKICPACRQEQERIQGLLARAREQTRPGRMSRAESEQVLDAVHDRLDLEPRTSPTWPALLKRPMVLVPAAAACAALAGVLVLTFQFERSPGHPDSALHQAAHNEELDREVIQNLDLLQDMETIQKLVSITDDDEQSKTSPNQSCIQPNADDQKALG